ncbi:MAG: glycoside hydrolase family 31 protein [Bacteroidales bacterium]|nr:glycoside hydrolase family 31 protein [Bacteroidales bacterium]
MKTKFSLYFLTAMFLILTSCGDDLLHVETTVDTSWWIGVINQGSAMPYSGSDELTIDLNMHPDGNQVQPLLLSNHGDVIWCETPPHVSFKDGEIIIDAEGKVTHTVAGNTLKEAYEFASLNYFPPSGKTPDMSLISAPQYNTWIELMYDQNQEDILKYANAIVANNYPPGVLMIDDNWQEDYGKWNFHQGRFDDPKMMMDSLHNMGFKVMLWVCPFVSPDCDVYRELNQMGVLMKNENSSAAMVHWWNGVSAELDLSNPAGLDWLNQQFNHLVKKYGVDGFKLDGGDPIYYKGLKSFEDILPDEHTMLWGKVGLRYPLNEYRAMYKMGGQPLVERLRDKHHKWADLQTLIPNMLLQGINGYVFGCPDMIGGGAFTSFLPGAEIDQELIVRSAQVHALMPMMQFSVAPWRILNEENQEAVHKAVSLRKKYTEYIVRLTENAALTNQPVVKYLEYVYPNQGYENVKDEFMLGDSILVAPVVEKNKYKRIVKLPEGNWEYIDGKKYTGPNEVEILAPIDVLPYFVKK